MEHISLFLDKFKNLGLKEFLVKEEISKIIKKICKVEVSSKNISYKDGILTIKGSRMLKSELFMKKQELIKEIENSLTKTKIDRLI